MASKETDVKDSIATPAVTTSKAIDPAAPCDESMSELNSLAYSKEETEGRDSGDSFEKRGERHPRKKRHAPSRAGSQAYPSRRLWTKEEDVAITQLVGRYGIRQWAIISKEIQEQYNIRGRSGKQCRERYR